MLIKWEEEDSSTRSLWKQMNEWVYAGFDQTYKTLGVHFDSYYYESNTYLLGKDHINKGLEAGSFYSKEDGSVWIDLEDAKLDHKLVLRSDGTSVYMTQDIGTAYKRYEDTNAEKMIYVVADEQDYHFKVLFEIMKRLGASFADGLHHLSYGMVDLPTGKMKSREGTVVDADDLVAEIIEEAALSAQERGEMDSLTEVEKAEIFRKIGLSALKFFILKVSAKKRMIFDPKESLDMQGQTGPYIQNAYVRIQSVLRKSGVKNDTLPSDYKELESIEKDLIKELAQYPKVILAGAQQIEPSIVANYCYGLAKLYHRFYHDCRILSAPEEHIKEFRLILSKQTAKIIKSGMNILGIEMPNRM
jgi:arginyl-tRNA synthetase